LFAKDLNQANILSQQKEGKTINIICESPINRIVFVTMTKAERSSGKKVHFRKGLGKSKMKGYIRLKEEKDKWIKCTFELAIFLSILIINVREAGYQVDIFEGGKEKFFATQALCLPIKPYVP
jgi:hypothetical protein